MSLEDTRSSEKVRPPVEGAYLRGPDYPDPQLTHVHDKLSRLMELLENMVVVLLTVTLLVLALMLRWREWLDLVELDDLQRTLSSDAGAHLVGGHARAPCL